jgi:hypothetical protein
METPIEWDPPDTSPTPSRRPTSPPPRENPVEIILRTQETPLLKRLAPYRNSTPPFLLRFLQEAETSYTHLVEHIYTEISEPRILSITDIGAFWDRDYECDPYAEEIEKRFGEPLKRAYSLWLQEEHMHHRLLDRAYWQIYRDPRDFIYSYLGYRRLFVYQEHYFQVTYENRFYLTLYGWTEDSCDTFMPERKHTPDDMIPEFHWFYSV